MSFSSKSFTKTFLKNDFLEKIVQCSILSLTHFPLQRRYLSVMLLEPRCGTWASLHGRAHHESAIDKFIRIIGAAVTYKGPIVWSGFNDLLRYKNKPLDVWLRILFLGSSLENILSLLKNSYWRFCNGSFPSQSYAQAPLSDARTGFLSSLGWLLAFVLASFSALAFSSSNLSHIQFVVSICSFVKDWLREVQSSTVSQGSVISVMWESKSFIISVYFKSFWT